MATAVAGHVIGFGLGTFDPDLNHTLPPGSGGGGGDGTAEATYSLSVDRLDGGSGSIRVYGFLPLFEGELPGGDTTRLRLDGPGGNDVPMAIQTRGAPFADGTPRVVGFHFTETVNDSETLSTYSMTRLASGSSRNTLNDLSWMPHSSSRNLVAPWTVGFPSAIAYPTVGQMCDSGLFGPQIPVADAEALGGLFAVHEQRFNAYSDYRWDPTSPVNGITNSLAFKATHINNTNYNGSDLSVSSNDFQNWRNAIGAVGSAGHNYYDASAIHFARFARTGNIEMFRRGAAYGWHYDREWAAKLSPPYQYQPHQVMPEGLYLHYMLTGDVGSFNAVQGMADRMYVIWDASYGSGTASGGEPRPMGYILLAAMFAELAGSSSRNWGSIVASYQDKNVAGTASRADGSWRTTAVGCTGGSFGSTYYSNFMHPINTDALTRSYDLVNADSRIPGRAKDAADFLYPGEWVAAADSFRQGFTGECDPNLWGNGDAVLNAIYPALFAWVYRNTGNASYLSIADEIFTDGSVKHSGLVTENPFLRGQKHFCEYYRWSGYYLKYREG